MRVAATEPAVPAAETSIEPDDDDDGGTLSIPRSLDDLGRRVIFRLQVGYGVDQGSPEPEVEPDVIAAGIRTLRLYTLGDLVAGTRGIGLPSLSTYFAARYFVDQDGRPSVGSLAPTVFDDFQGGHAVLARYGYVQIDGLGDGVFRPLFLRAGRQYHYGAVIAHFDGLSVAYDTRTLDLSAFVGRRVALFGEAAEFGGEPGVLSGAAARLRLTGARGIPLTLGVEALKPSFDVRVLEATVDVELQRGVLVGARARTRGTELARWRATVDARLGRTTTVAFDVDDRRTADYLYDLVLADALSDRHLFLGTPASRLRATLRAGTLLFDNWDVLGLAAVGFVHGDARSSLLPSFVEGGGGVTARFQGGLSAGAQGRVRRYLRPEHESMDELVDEGAYGERSFREATLDVRYALGVRRFSAELEAYIRHYDSVSIDVDLPEQDDVRAGGRFRVEGWLKKLRVLAEYDLAAAPDAALPTLDTLHSLRLMVEASF